MKTSQQGRLQVVTRKSQLADGNLHVTKMLFALKQMVKLTGNFSFIKIKYETKKNQRFKPICAILLHFL